MTEATIDRLARLAHETWRRRYRRRRTELGLPQVPDDWDGLDDWHQDDYRAVARAVAEAVGSRRKGAARA